jgi:polysaccharide pyruvyl transferase WcaK-like protein
MRFVTANSEINLASTEPSGVALLSPCGFGNLGDAAIMSAAIDEIRARLPRSEIVAFTLNPADTTQRHGIPAFALDAQTLSGFGRAKEAEQGLRGLIEKGLARVSRFSSRIAAALRWTINVATGPWREWQHWWATAQIVRKCRYVVVCGGGQLDEFWGGPWGHPYAMFKFARLARDAGARFIILSSGSATLRSDLGRWLVGSALKRAGYRSFREDFAVDLSRDLGAPEPNQWFPDLAFSLRVPTNLSEAHTRRRIGISPIAWCDPYAWPEPDARRYDSYLERLADFVRSVLAREDDVVLFATAGADHRVMTDLVSRLKSSGTLPSNDRLQVSSARTVADLLDVLQTLDVVVASRLHGVILAYACHLPVAAVSYDPKVDFVIHRFRQGDTSVPIDTFDVDRLRAIVDSLYEDRQAVAKSLEQGVAAWQVLLRKQYDAVFGDGPAATSAPQTLLPLEAVMSR